MDTWIVSTFWLLWMRYDFSPPSPAFVSGWDILLWFPLIPFSISYLCDFLFSLTVVQVKYKADLKKLHKPVTDMKESLIMNHVLNTSQLASSVSSIICSRNSLFHPFATKFLLWGHLHLLLCYWGTIFIRKLSCSLSAFFQITTLTYQFSTDYNTSQNIKMLFWDYLNFFSINHSLSPF